MSVASSRPRKSGDTGAGAGGGVDPDQPVKLGRLVVGFDRDAQSRSAVSWAARRLAPGGELVLVHACRPLHAPAPLTSERERHAHGRALLDELLLEGEDELLEAAIHTVVSDTDPVSALTSAATSFDADAIVVGHRTHSPVRRAIPTVTAELLAHAAVPVIVIPAGMARR